MRSRRQFFFRRLIQTFQRRRSRSSIPSEPITNTAATYYMFLGVPVKDNP